MTMTYNDYVKRAKKLVDQIEHYQVEIARMALAVCEIRHGGRSSGFYTLSEFANDIGVSRKSLGRWVSVYRDILSRIDISKPTKEEWEAGMRTLRALTAQNTVENNENGTPGSKKLNLKNLPKQKALATFELIKSDPDGGLIKLTRLLKTSKHVAYMASTVEVSKKNQKIIKEIILNLSEATMILEMAMDFVVPNQA